MMIVHCPSCGRTTATIEPLLLCPSCHQPMAQQPGHWSGIEPGALTLALAAMLFAVLSLYFAWH